MKTQDTFLGIPYDWHRPTWKRIKERIWNKKDHHLFTPKIFGWGYTINLYELFYRRKGVLLTLLIVLFIFLALFIKQIKDLNTAHSTFENYYAFRGCQQLLTKTDSYGTCKTASGQTIKIVKYANNKWYLDGDLPCGPLCF